MSLRSITPDGNLHLEVEDGGPGILAEHLPHIFERFYRVDDTGEPGNGLSTARSIAEARNTRIEAVIYPDEGTRMMLHLPLLPPSENAPFWSSARPRRVYILRTGGRRIERCRPAA